MAHGSSSNGSSGSGVKGAPVQRKAIDPKTWEVLRAHVDTICETLRRTNGVEGPDLPWVLRAAASAIRKSIPLQEQAATLAIAQADALDIASGRLSPPDETSETRRKRAAGRDDSSPGRKG